MGMIPKIIRVTYSMELNEELIAKCTQKAPFIRPALERNIEGYHNMCFDFGKPKSLDISFTTNDITEFDPKKNIEIWQRIAKIIETIIEED